MNIKRTLWFSGESKPVREGVYERIYHNNSKDIRYCFWDGELWHVGYPVIQTRSFGIAHQQDLPWRGIHNEFDILVSGN